MSTYQKYGQNGSWQFVFLTKRLCKILPQKNWTDKMSSWQNVSQNTCWQNVFLTKRLSKIHDKMSPWQYVFLTKRLQTSNLFFIFCLTFLVRIAQDVCFCYFGGNWHGGVKSRHGGHQRLLCNVKIERQVDHSKVLKDPFLKANGLSCNDFHHLFVCHFTSAFSFPHAHEWI